VTIIVPWAAGGSTDQVTRLAAVEIEKALNQKVVIVNQPGASGSIGTKNALEAAKDGYTWTPPKTSAPIPSAACSTPRSAIGGST
jgi:tripartite-type tricarboxylate transporter receptor subunit TctC